MTADHSLSLSVFRPLTTVEELRLTFCFHRINNPFCNNDVKEVYIVVSIHSSVFIRTAEMTGDPISISL